jgi:hypothetical protein
MSALEAARELRRRRLEDARQALQEGILVLAKRDGLAVTEDLARERANNILFVLIEEGLVR